MTPPFNLAVVERETAGAIEAGHRIFQTHKYAADDVGQVDVLLGILNPPDGANVLDAGCGIGEVARLMSARRPDLFFALMNLSLLQLSKCPVGVQYAHALDNCEAMMFHDSVFDCAMYSSALCQMDIPVALREARRVLVEGGILLINDMVHPDGYRPELEALIAARVLGKDQLVAEIEAAGFTIDSIHTPPFDASHFDALAEQAGIAHHVAGLTPIIIRAYARKES